MTMKIVCPCCGGDHVAEVQSLDFSCSDCGGATLIDFTDPVEIVVENKVFLNDGTSSSDFVALDHENGRITIKTDVDLAKTLAFVFSVSTRS